MLRIPADLSRMTIGAGEAFIHEIQLLLANGSSKDVADTSMILTLYQPGSRETAERIEYERLEDEDGFELFRIARDGAFSESLLGKTGLLFELARRFKNSRQVLYRGEFTVTATSATLPSLDTESIGDTACRVTIKDNAQRGGDAAISVEYVAYSDAPPPTPPSFLAAPAIGHDGTPRVGETGSITWGTIAGGTSALREVLLNGTALSGPLPSSLTFEPGTYRLHEVAEGPGGETPAFSAPVVVPAPAPTISFGTLDLVKLEGNTGTAIFSAPINLARDGSTAALAYTWQVVPIGTNPVDAADFGGTLPSGSGTFTAGQTSKTVTFLVTGDAAVEPDETFRLQVTLTGFNTITADGTITNDDVAPSLPSAPFLTLFAEDATTPNVVRNRAEGTLPVSIWGPSRPSEHPLINLFGNASTVTGNEPGEDGAAKAVRVNWAADTQGHWFLHGVGNIQSPGGVMVPAGTWTLTWTAKSLSAASYVVTLADQAGGMSGNQNYTVTTTDQTFSRTFTLASPALCRFFFQAGGGGIAANGVRFDHFRLVAGSTAGVSEPSLRHVSRVGRFAMSGNVIRTQPVTNNNVAGVEAYSAVSLGAATKLDAVSLAVTVSMDTVGSLTGVIYPLISSANAPWNSVGNTPFEFGQVGTLFGLKGLPTGGGNLDTAFAGPVGSGWTTFIVTAGPNGTTLYANGVRLYSNTQALNGPTLSALALFGRNFSSSFPGKVALAGAWNRALSKAEVAQAHAYMASHVRGLGETYVEPAQQWIAEGDSITNGGVSGGYVVSASRMFRLRPQVASYAVPGDGIEVLENRKAVVGPHIAEVIALGKQPVLTVLIGTNNSNVWKVDPTTYANRLEAYWIWARGQGAKVVAQTVTAYRGLTASEQNNLKQLNVLIRNKATGGSADGLADHDMTDMGTWSSTYFEDDVHTTQAGADLMGQTLKAALQPLLADRL